MLDRYEELYRSFPYYAEPQNAENALEYYQDFWEVIDDPDEFEDEILDGACVIHDGQVRFGPAREALEGGS